MFTKYGTGVLLKYLVLAAALTAGVWLLVPSDAVRYAWTAVAAVLTGFVLNFFRDPARTTPEGEGLVTAPADGRVVLIKELFEPEYLGAEAVQISIFMSPLDVHVNRFPISGVVGHYRYIPGAFVPAFQEKSSERNERTHIGVDDQGYRVLFKQIAGTVARRIVADVAIRQNARRGERFGMIKFGSRLDVIVPKQSRVRVAVNDRVLAGETVLAEYGTHPSGGRS